MNKDRLCSNCKGYKVCRLESLRNDLQRNKQSEGYIQEVVRNHNFYAECEFGQQSDLGETRDPLAISPNLLLKDQNEKQDLIDSMKRYSED